MADAKAGSPRAKVFQERAIAHPRCLDVMTAVKQAFCDVEPVQRAFAGVGPTEVT